jgi:multicomponent Na+:H+ antiporter subunit E
VSLLPVNMLIAVAWAAAAGDFSTITLGVGFAAGFLALYAFEGLPGDIGYHRRVLAALGLTAYFIYDLVKSSVEVAGAVLSPARRQRSQFVIMPLDVRSEFGIMLTANLISLTPGTLSVDVAADRRTLLIHAMFADDPAGVVKGLKDGIERRVLEVTE